MSSGQREPLPTDVSDLPPLPPAYDAALDEGLADLDLQPAEEVRRAIDDHVRLLLAWNRVMNLTAIVDPAEAARLHVIDSLTAAPLLRAGGVAAFVDLGSGGGFPGFPLAAVLGVDAWLVESVGKKARFLEAATRATGLADRVGVAATRAETLAADPVHRERWPAATARALATLPEILEIAFPLLEPGGTLVAWKRGDIAPELEAAEGAGQALGGARIEVEDVPVAALAGHLLVVVTKLGRTPDEFPRDPAARRRRPWEASGPRALLR